MKEQEAVAAGLGSEASQFVDRLEIDHVHKWSMIMDMLKESVPERGIFFVEVGGKNKQVNFWGGTPREADTRALILMQSVKDNNGDDVYVAITREGAKAMRDTFINSGVITNWLTNENTKQLDAYNNQRHILSLSSIIRRLSNGDEGLFERESEAGLLGTDKDRFADGQHISFGFIQRRLRRLAFPYLHDSITYPVEDVIDVSLIRKAFDASYAVAKPHKDSPTLVNK